MMENILKCAFSSFLDNYFAEVIHQINLENEKHESHISKEVVLFVFGPSLLKSNPSTLCKLSAEMSARSNYASKTNETVKDISNAFAVLSQYWSPNWSSLTLITVELSVELYQSA